MPTLELSLRDLLDRAVAAGILSADQAAAVAAALDARPAARRGAVLAEVLGYVGGALAVVAALFLGAELWDELGPRGRGCCCSAPSPWRVRGWRGPYRPRRVRRAGSASSAGGGRRRRGGHRGGGRRRLDRRRAGHGGARRGGSSAGRGGTAVVGAARVFEHVATFTAAAATPSTAVDRIGDGAFDWGGPLLWAFGLAWLAASALPVRTRVRQSLHESASTVSAAGNDVPAAGAGRPGTRDGGDSADTPRSRVGWGRAPSPS